MKKFLSLVLALVMTMSLVTVSAGAKTFTDDAAIDYTEAVEVVKACKIIDGYADGSFNPTATLTRGAAAKIICNLILGPTTASALSADAAPYKDVAANNTFAGYIAYCAKEGIVSGYADGTFKPGNTLTGYAFWKMLLGALGYDANIEGYVGNNWSISVAKRGLSDDVDLASGLSGDFDGQKAVTRQEACLYVFNALQAKVASYGNTTTVTVGGTDVTVGGSKVQFVNGTFMANYFKKLGKNDSATDDAGRPATQWTYDDKEIGTYAKTPKVVFTKDDKAYKLRDAIGKLTSTDVVTFYYSINTIATRQDVNAGPAVGQIKSSQSTKLSAALGDCLKAYIGNGVSVEVYYKKNSDTQTKIVVVDEFIGKVTAVKSDDEGRFVRVNSKDFHTDDFAVGDWVLYTVENGGIATMKAAEKLTGKITKITGGDTWTIDGTDYEAHGGKYACTDMDSRAVGEVVDFYLDSNGYIIKADLNSSSILAENLALFTAVKPSDGIDATKAAAIYGNGTKETVTLTDDSLTSKMTVYRMTKDGSKVKAEATDYVSTYYRHSANADVAGNYKFTKGATVIQEGIGNQEVVAKVNGNTAFVLIDGTTINTYVGYKNAPQFQNATKVVTYGKAGEAAVVVYVWVSNSDVSSSGDTNTYFFAKLGDKVQTTNDKGDSVTYYTVKTTSGETVKVKDTAADCIEYYEDVNKIPVAVVAGLHKDSNGIVTKFTLQNKFAHSTLASNAVVKVDNDVLVLGSAELAFTSDVKVSVVNKDCDTIEAIDIDAIDESQDAYSAYSVVYTNNDGTNIVSELFLYQR